MINIDVKEVQNTEKSPKTIIGAQFDTEVVKRLDEEAKRMCCSKSAVVRYAVIKYLNECDKEAK